MGWNDIYLVVTAMYDTMNVATTTQWNYFHMPECTGTGIKSGLCAEVISSVVSGVVGAGSYRLPRHYPFGPWPKYLLSSSNNLSEIKTFPGDNIMHS